MLVQIRNDDGLVPSVRLEIRLEVLELVLGLDADPVVEDLERDALVRRAERHDLVDVVVGAALRAAG